MNIRDIFITLLFCTYLSLSRAMEPVQSSVPSLKQLAAKRAVTTRAFLDEFIDDDEFLSKCDLPDAHADLAQIVACNDRLSIMLAQRIAPIQTIRSMPQEIMFGAINFDDLLQKKIEFVTQDGNTRATLQNNEDYRALHIFKRKGQNKPWEPQRICVGHLKSITEAAWSADARFLASFSAHEKSIKIWDVSSGNCLYTLQYPDGVLSASDQPYWHGDNATLILPSTFQRHETRWHVPWAQASLNDMLALKALILRTLPAEKRVELLKRIQNNYIQEKMTAYLKRYDAQVRSAIKNQDNATK